MRSAIGALVFLLTAKVTAAPLRLVDVLDQVAHAGPEQAAARAQIAVTHADVETATMWPNPTLRFNGQRSSPMFTGALQAPLPIFGQRGARIDAASATVDQTRAEADLAVWRLRRDARIAYYAAVRANDEIVIAAELEALTQRIAKMAASRYEVGSGPRLEQEQAALLHARAVQDSADRQALAMTTRAELARLLGVPLEGLGQLTDPLDRSGPMPPLDEVLAGADSHHPALRALAHEHAAAQARGTAARAALRPTPIVEIGVDMQEPANCGDGTSTSRCATPRGALWLDLPIFNLNRGPIRRAEAEAQLADAKARVTRIRIQTAIRIAHTNLEAAIVRARFFDDEYRPAAVRVEAMAREGYTTGRTGLLPLIEASRAVLEAQLGRAAALFSLQVARADLEEASGVPLPVL